MLYHALFHWRHRLLARLRRELKAELRRRKVRRRGVLQCGGAPGKSTTWLLPWANCPAALLLCWRLTRFKLLTPSARSYPCQPSCSFASLSARMCTLPTPPKAR